MSGEGASRQRGQCKGPAVGVCGFDEDVGDTLSLGVGGWVTAEGSGGVWDTHSVCACLCACTCMMNLIPLPYSCLPAKIASLDVQHQTTEWVINPFPSLGDFQCWPVSVSRAPVVPDCDCPFELLGGLLKPLIPTPRKTEPLGEGPRHLMILTHSQIQGA